MKLFGADASPFTQRVKIVARLKGFDLPLSPLPEGGLKGDILMGLNPMGRMPVLVADEGWALAESVAIMAFLDETLEGPSLMPVDPQERARVRWYVQLVDADLSVGLRNIVRSRVVPGSASPLTERDSADIAELGLAELNETFAAIATLATDAEHWLVGDKVTLADVALFPILIMPDVVRPWNKVRDSIIIPPVLTAYRDRLLLDPVFGVAASELEASFRHIAELWGLTAA